MNCEYCGALIPPNSTTCPSCGAAVTNVPPPSYTPAPPPQQAYAPQFAQPQAPAKSKTAYVLLAIFLGSLGIHNFYAGYTGKGVAQLLITILTCGYGGIVSWIWAIIEVCTVNADAKGVPFA